MHQYHPQALVRGQGLRDGAAVARRGGRARREPGPHAATSLVCLHASASSGRQWGALSPRHRPVDLVNAAIDAHIAQLR